MLRSSKDSLYDEEGQIIFNALDWILSNSLNRYSGIYYNAKFGHYTQEWVLYMKTGPALER